MISLSGGIILIAAFAIAFALSRLIIKSRAAKAAAQEQLRTEQLLRNAPPSAPAKNKSKKRREARMKR